MVQIHVVRARVLFYTVLLACLPDLELAQPPGDTCGSGFVDLENGEMCDPGGDAAIGCTSLCQIDCDGGALDPQTNHCYFWTQSSDSIDNAMKFCGQAGAHVVGFADLQELQAVVTKSKTLPGAPDSGGGVWAWLEKTGGANDAGVPTYYVPGTNIAPGWAITCPGCFALADGGDGGDFPLNGQNPQFCVFWKRSTSASWVQVACTTGSNSIPTLCEREPLGAFSTACTDDAAAGNTCIEIPRSAATKRYELTSKAFSFDNARAECVARGGMLAHLESGSEREEVVGEIARVMGPTADVWIGLAFDGSAWSWVDGTQAPAVFPTPWADGEPSANAGAATLHLELGRWDTGLARVSDTSTTFRALCQFSK